MKQYCNKLFSPLFPPESSGQALKGRLASKLFLLEHPAIAPLRGLGVSIPDFNNAKN